MRTAYLVALASALVFAFPAPAEVKSSTEFGFEIANSVTVDAPVEQVYKSIAQVSGWWNASHSYSRDARNLSLSLRAGGCFCERLPKAGGFVEHGRVIYLEPRKMVRLSSALGPLQAEGVSGVLTWTLEADGNRTRITNSYVVGGYIRAGSKRLAPLVDQVLGEQLARLKAFAERR